MPNDLVRKAMATVKAVAPCKVKPLKTSKLQFVFEKKLIIINVRMLLSDVVRSISAVFVGKYRVKQREIVVMEIRVICNIFI